MAPRAKLVSDYQRAVLDTAAQLAAGYAAADRFPSVPGILKEARILVDAVLSSVPEKP